jgi:N-acyl-D-aspartate/D-glutamate deacylase
MKTVIEMAREAGFKEHNGVIYVTTITDDCAKELNAFAELVRADEREACAKVCEDSVEYAGDELARQIRARSNT